MRQTAGETALLTVVMNFCSITLFRFLTPPFFQVKFRCPFTAGQARAGVPFKEPLPVEWWHATQMMGDRA